MGLRAKENVKKNSSIYQDILFKVKRKLFLSVSYRMKRSKCIMSFLFHPTRLVGFSQYTWVIFHMSRSILLKRRAFIKVSIEF